MGRSHHSHLDLGKLALWLEESIETSQPPYGMRESRWLSIMCTARLVFFPVVSIGFVCLDAWYEFAFLDDLPLVPSWRLFDKTIQKQQEQQQFDTLSWYPTEEWIRDCVDRQNQKEMKPYNVHWIKYDLGDCILRGCQRFAKSSGSSEYGNLSIVGQYWIHACHLQQDNATLGSNLEYIEQLFQQYTVDPYPYDAPWEVPADDELVIHLRIGDVMDDAMYIGENTTVLEMLSVGASTRHGPNAVYPHGVKSLQEFLWHIQRSGLSKVVLRGGPNSPKIYPKSQIYTQCLAEGMENAEFHVTNLDVHGEHNPDQDFFFMSHAKFFVPSTGGYSELIAKMVHRLGGQVLEFPNTTTAT